MHWLAGGTFWRDAMRLHPATYIILDKEDIEDAIRQSIYAEHPEYKTNHNMYIETNLEKVNIKVICCTPIKEKEKED